MYDPWTYAEKYKNERAAQTALFMWANMACNFGLTAANNPVSYTVAGAAQKASFLNDLIPQLKWLHAIHNQGHGDKIRGGMAKAEGVKAGVSDMFLPWPKRWIEGYGEYSGLYLELKIGNNKPSPIQLEFMQDMRAAGYAAEWAIGWLEARDKILGYLQIHA